MASDSTVSVIIPVYNAETLLERAVCSVLAEREQGLCEILLIEDGSSDNSLAVCRKLAAEYPDIIRLMTHPDGRNHGAAVSRNRGIECARGSYIAFLDADDYWLPERLAEARQILLTHPDIDGVYDVCEYVFSDDESKERFQKQPRALMGPTRDVPPQRLFDMLFDREVPLWCTNGILLRRNVFDRVGLMNPAFPKGQDIELWMRLAMTCKLLGSPSRRPKAVYWRHLNNRWNPSSTSFLERIKVESQFLHSWQEWLLTHPAPDRIRIRVLRRLMRHLGFLFRFGEAYRIAARHGRRRLFLYAICFPLPEWSLLLVFLKRVRWWIGDTLRHIRKAIIHDKP